jgi:PAS domain S-box-containing protein
MSDSDVLEIEFRMKTADQNWRWLYARTVVLRRLPDGKPGQIVGAARDITARKKMEEELRRQQLLLTTIADATPDTILLVDVIEDRVIYANHQVSSHPDSADHEASASDDAERRRRVLEQDLFKRTAFMRGFTQPHDNKVREMEYRVKDAHGKWRWIWTRGKVFRRLPDGRVWQIILVGQDVTDKKENQQQLRQANKELKVQQETLRDLNNQLEIRVQIRTHELKESAERLRMLLEAMPQMTWTARPDGTIDYYNQQWYTYTGVDPAAILDGYAPLVIHPEDLSETGQRWMHSVKTGEPFEQENRMRRASDGSWRWHLNRALPIRDALGEIRLWTGTSTDTHDLKMALENLTEVNAALDNFVHIAAHDLRSPVNNLKLLFGLHDKARSPQESAAIYQAMEESVRRLDNTVHGLIEVLEVQNSSQVPAREVRFGEVVDYIVKDYSAELEKCRGRIETDFSQCPSIRYVEAYLFSIVRNFLSNAIKYRSPHRDLVVKVSSRREKDMVVLEVSDNGIGINLSKYGKDLFNPFSRFTTQAYGKGLGLHLVRNMVEKDGGSIRAESEPDSGTTFYVTLKEYPAQEQPRGV